jgi:uncharacterized RDD family membrane protein YckC
VIAEEAYVIETPEHVELRYTVAGPGSRLLAFLLDSVVMLVPGILLLVFVFVLLAGLAEERIQEALAGVGDPDGQAFFVWLLMAFFALAQFLVSQFYFVVFELLWNGQSPGKRWQRIRVMREGGQPVGLYASMIRNLMRIVDMLPGTYLAAYVSMLASHHWRRLGDLAAGTIVVKLERGGIEDPGSARSRRERLEAEAGAPWPPADADREAAGARRLVEAGLLRLDPSYFELAGRFLERRHQLDAIAALSLAERIARPAMERLGISDTEPERFLEQAVECWRRERRAP